MILSIEAEKAFDKIRPPSMFSWVSLPYCSPPRCPFPIKSLALWARVSLDNSFPSVRQEPGFGPWKGSPFLQQFLNFSIIRITWRVWKKTLLSPTHESVMQEVCGRTWELRFLRSSQAVLMLPTWEPHWEPRLWAMGALGAACKMMDGWWSLA